MTIGVQVDDMYSQYWENRKITYETFVNFSLTPNNDKKYLFTIILVYEEIIAPESNFPRKLLTHYKIQDDDKSLPYPTNYAELEYRLTKVFTNLSDTEKMKIKRKEVIDTVSKIVKEIREVIRKYEITAYI